MMNLVSWPSNVFLLAELFPSLARGASIRFGLSNHLTGHGLLRTDGSWLQRKAWLLRTIILNGLLRLRSPKCTILC